MTVNLCMIGLDTYSPLLERIFSRKQGNIKFLEKKDCKPKIKNFKSGNKFMDGKFLNNGT